ncbi:hypothetical protein [Synechococcus sp. PCC 7336]|uniref:hypothetical protein n=1 Tax=Synechococcus sp. PCC 7336 TaxID=195250 RepID=UPI00037A1A3B|nr:hypothetical protein [Synechococcus sp. PCC 7336]
MGKSTTRFWLFFVSALTILVLLVYEPAYAQTQPASTNFWSNLDTSVKVIAGVVAAITAVLGVPVAFLQIRKTIVEIRKIELEAQKLQEQTETEFPKEFEGHRIYLDHSDGNNIQILVDPRFSAPLLILLDFVIVYIVLALAGYAVGVFLPGKAGQIILTVVATFLLLPLFVEALRLRGVLRPSWGKGQNEDKKN